MRSPATLALAPALALLTSLAAGAQEPGPPPARTGDLWTTVDASGTTLTVASRRHDFVIFLPWSDDWSFESDEETVMTGVNPEYTVTVSRRKITDARPRDVLDEALDDLLAHDARVRFLQYVEREGNEVLTLQARHSETGPWNWFYWVLIPTDRYWLQVTVIDADTQELEPLDVEMVEALARATTLRAALGEEVADSATVP